MRTIFFGLTTMLIMIIAAIPAYAQVEGLILYLSFDEGAGDVVKDASGHGNDGEILGAEWVNGKDGSALEFNGADAYVEVPYDDMFSLTESFTLAAWVKPAQSPFAGEQWRGIINGQKTNHGPYLLQMSASNGEIGAWLGGTWVYQLTTAVLDTENFWHLVGTYDVGEGFKNYVNGEFDSQNATAGTEVAGNVDEGVVIGHNYGFASRWFEGVIDEAVIFNRALEIEEVEALYNGDIKELVTAVDPAVALTTTWANVKAR